MEPTPRREVQTGMWLIPIALAHAECPATVAELPEHTLFEASDPRLRGPSVVVVFKEQRELGVYGGGTLATTAAGDKACWPVALAAGYAVGHKQRRGDLRTPEGWQRTSDRPWSSYYAALTVHYPAPHDAVRGLAAGLIDTAQHDAIIAAHAAGLAPPMDTRLGGRIVIHGGGSSSDWTLGCVALEDDDIDVMRSLLPPSQRTDLLVLP